MEELSAYLTCSVYNQVIITDHQVENYYLKFHSGYKSLRDEQRPRC